MPRDDEISTAELLRLTGIPRRTLTRWTADGVIGQVRRGTWSHPETLQAIVAHLRSQHDSANDRTRLLREQTRGHRLKNDKLGSTLVPRNDCEEGYQTITGMFVAALEALGPRLAAELPGVDDLGQAREIVRQEVRKVRGELSRKLLEISERLRESGDPWLD